MSHISTYLQGESAMEMDFKHPSLNNIKAKLLARGFNVHPPKILSEIDKESERQFYDVMKECLHGMSIPNLVLVRDELYAWLQADNEEFEAERARIKASSPIGEANIGEAVAPPPPRSEASSLEDIFSSIPPKTKRTK